MVVSLPFYYFFSYRRPLIKNTNAQWVASYSTNQMHLHLHLIIYPFYVFFFKLNSLFQQTGNLVRRFLPRAQLVGAHRGQDCHHEFQAFVKLLLHFLTQSKRGIPASVVRQFQIFSRFSLFVHQRHVVVVVDVQQRVFRFGDDRNFQVVASWNEFITSFTAEDVFGDKVALGVAVLTSFGRGNVDDLWAVEESLEGEGSE